MKVAIIGAGNMGGIIARRLNAKAFDVVCSDVSYEALLAITETDPAIGTTKDNRAAAEGADAIVLAVKPTLMPTVIAEIAPVIDGARQLVFSVAAEVSFAQIDALFEQAGAPAPRYLFRLVPNTAAAVGQSMNFLAGRNATPEAMVIAHALCDALGRTIVIGDEAKFVAATALGSCGIAFAMRYIRAACEGAVELGIAPADARAIVMQTLRGAVELLAAAGTHPEAEIDRVTSPGGITIRGLNELEHAGFTSAVVRGLKACR